ncbi:M24 family metallopeptidase [Lacticaseibacillus zhaodongensis]|uniref:M24 family metallopeptidase n=1 Tax=Lacticaseibacillus zhaodongensis TaxID=2668065 RepID=UPI0012D340CB|nr:Xaa-Pro peptidase family protein [Lacticaseibacillus zhaodongensis]
MSRIEALRKEMIGAKLDALLVTDPVNVSYLTGFTGNESALMLTPDAGTFITDSRFAEQVQQEVSGFTVQLHTTGLLPEAGELAAAAGVKVLGFEADTMTYSDYSLLKHSFTGQLKPASDFVERIREVKDDDELMLIERAIEIAEAGYDHVIKTIKAGMTELAVATDLDFFMRGLGASGLSFETIVASGARSAMPHGSATDRVIQDGDIVTLDWGCVYKGYVSDITRTFAIGTPDPKLDEIYKIVYAANRAVAKIMGPGVTGAQIHAAAHQVIDGAGYKQYFGHGTGHGIGRGIHEGPGAWGRYMQVEQQPGNVETDEPGIYLPEIGGVRIEDDLLVTRDGNQQLTALAPATLPHINN